MQIRFLSLMMRRMLFSLFILTWIFLLLPYFIPLHAPQQSFTEKPYSESRFIRSHNTWVHYRQFLPQGDTCIGKIMLVHGFSGSTFGWRENTAVLQNAGYLVCAIDLPPFGYSDKRPSANFSDSLWVGMIRSLMDSVDYNVPTENEKWVLTGHSMGGMIIGAFATRFPEKTRALVYVDGTSPDSDGKQSPGLKMTAAFFRQGFVHRWSDVLMERYFFREKRFAALLESAYGRVVSEEEVRGYMEPFSYRNSASTVMRFASRTGFARVDQKILQTFPRMLIWGKKDQWIPIDGAVHFLKDNPDIEHYFIEEAGHCPMETHPEEFNTALLNFLKTL